MKYITHSLEEMQKLATSFAGDLSPKNNRAVVVGLYGELGAGKTSFVQGLVSALGVEGNIVSPTFVIMKSYPLPHNSHFKHIIHIDAYRLEKSEELLSLGWDKIVSDPTNLVVIEWPERVADIMPEHIRINFTLPALTIVRGQAGHISENEREVEMVI